MTKLKVKISYYNFYFDNAQEAVQFALAAKTHSGEEDIPVSIDFVEVEDPEDGQS
jgi:hypothetical protein